MWPLRLRVRRLLPGQGPLLRLGRPHVLQILPRRSVHQEVGPPQPLIKQHRRLRETRRHPALRNGHQYAPSILCYHFPPLLFFFPLTGRWHFHHMLETPLSLTHPPPPLCSNPSRRFRRQDVRHGNAVQLCNGLQIDGERVRGVARVCAAMRACCCMFAK